MHLTYIDSRFDVFNNVAQDKLKLETSIHKPKCEKCETSEFGASVCSSFFLSLKNCWMTLKRSTNGDKMLTDIGQCYKTFFGANLDFSQTETYNNSLFRWIDLHKDLKHGSFKTLKLSMYFKITLAAVVNVFKQ